MLTLHTDASLHVVPGAKNMILNIFSPIDLEKIAFFAKNVTGLCKKYYNIDL
jgi:hypothetical protein